MSSDSFAQATDALRAARRVVVLSGAGMSAESGVPTFREAQSGLWEEFDPSRLATPEAWEADPPFVWAWYAWRVALVRAVEPNAGHRALAELARTHDVTIVTQNVDDLHERAGSSRVHHVHGSLFAHRCDTCDAPMEVGPPPAEPVDSLTPPSCDRCGGRARPGVVWFGEMLPGRPWDAAVDAVTSAAAVLVVGTSGLVHPAASLPGLAADARIPVVEVNPGPSGLGSEVSVHVRATAGQALPQLLAP